MENGGKWLRKHIYAATNPAECPLHPILYIVRVLPARLVTGWQWRLFGFKKSGVTTEFILTEWQWPISGVHSIMMEKSAPAGEGGGGSSYHHVQSCSVNSS